MATPFIGQISMFAFNFPPRSWAQCNGQLLAIAQNQALFSLLGTTYGGNGTTTFALPDLRGRTPLHWGQGPGLSNRTLGQNGGEENHTLITTEMPAHNHLMNANSGSPTASSPSGNFAAQNTSAYSTTSNATMNSADIGNMGGSQPHPNQSPYLVINICIALAGIFPSRN
jgi:microcystin-dependent protein